MILTVMYAITESAIKPEKRFECLFFRLNRISLQGPFSSYDTVI